MRVELQALDIDVSRETAEHLLEYENMLIQWTKKINLISKGTLGEVRSRHIADSAQIFPYIPPSARNLSDFGSGGGLPAIVLAILLRGAGRQTGVTLVEADLRKATFLRQVSRQLSLDTTVIVKRAEDVSPLAADVVTARALAPLDRLLDLVVPHMAPSAIAIFPKGEKTEQELASASQNWSFDVERIPSRTAVNSTLLILKGIVRV